MTIITTKRQSHKIPKPTWWTIFYNHRLGFWLSRSSCYKIWVWKNILPAKICTWCNVQSVSGLSKRSKFALKPSMYTANQWTIETCKWNNSVPRNQKFLRVRDRYCIIVKLQLFRKEAIEFRRTRGYVGQCCCEFFSEKVWLKYMIVKRNAQIFSLDEFLLFEKSVLYIRSTTAGLLLLLQQLIAENTKLQYGKLRSMAWYNLLLFSSHYHWE